MIFMLDKPIEVFLKDRPKILSKYRTEKIPKTRETLRRASHAEYNQMTLFTESNDPASPILMKRKSVESK